MAQSSRLPSAIPPVYFAIFGIYEPMLTVVGFIGALLDPKKVCLRVLFAFFHLNTYTTAQTHDGQAPWPNDIPPEVPLPRATLVTIIQLAHVCGLIGVVNAFVLWAARKHLSSQPAIQEKIVKALLTPLLIGDVLHLVVTLWALGDVKWQFGRWSSLLWTTLILGLTLLFPRMTWHLGWGRYVDKRDGVRYKIQ